ncbi:histidine phosphatase family protein [Kitasatospora sp. NBC_01287]|uniref:SixA phosphatase family protein n=1 Tax=Kitasatospora sp. NBC_01287 TaxID=2903573 RepID=UPI0022503C6C|nr:histidine phosphatase family protein [Kitasatospora sp. NBC_01287]MCX4746064.1 histidine phosphatase family protein [Kitasatospora sp. NBC_01287]
MSLNASRRITVLRHAKADWPEVADHERPLADRGRHQAPAAGEWLADSGINPDFVLCSTSVRTRDTWKLVAHELPKRARKTVFEDRIYEATAGEIIEVLQETPEQYADLILIGHNPGVQSLVEVLAGDVSLGDELSRLRQGGFPTAGIAVLSFEGSWKAVEPGVGTLVSYYVPPQD